MIDDKKLLEAIKKSNLIDQNKFKGIIEEAEREKIEVISMVRKLIDPEEITKIEAGFYNMEYKNLLEEKIPEKALHIISSDVAQNYKVICFDKKDKKIKVGVTNPDNFKAIEAIDFLAKGGGLSAKYFYISTQSFSAAFRRYKSLSKELSSALEIRQEEENQAGGGEATENEEEVTKSAPVAKIVSVIIRHAVDGGASDIHIEPLKNESRVRYRIDGILHTSLVLPKSVHRAIVARVKVMADLKLDETRVPQDGRFKSVIGEKEIDFRVSSLPLSGSEKIVMRILNTGKGAPKMKDLGIQGVQYDVIMNNIKKTEGMLLVTGPTGSGKSTTIFSILDILNVEGVNVVTLEDPVEYQMKGVNQSQVRPKVGYTFASGLRSFLRQDPDIILVGEIRDEETAELSVHAALTGHFVLSTLHTTSAVSTIARLVDMGIEPFLIGSTLHTVIAQRLVRRICEHCKKEEDMPDDIAKSIRKIVADIGEEYVKKFVKGLDLDNLKFYKGEGCARCGNSGYEGRVSIMEVLDINKELQKIIKNGQKFISDEEVRDNQQFVTARQDGIIKVLQGLTAYEEILRVMKD
jgi:type IV pilus assembly protein PilB